MNEPQSQNDSNQHRLQQDRIHLAELQIYHLQNQMTKAFKRIDRLETCVKIADANEPCRPAILKDEAQLASDHITHLETRLKELKAERDDQTKEIILLKSELQGWQLLFNTKQLAHARAVRDNNESARTNLENANDWQAKKIKELEDQLANQGIIIKEYREKYDKSCSLVAKMHAAAMGKVCGPKVGVVEDIEELRKERDALKGEYEMRRDWIQKMLKILDCENKDGRNCRDAHAVALELVNENADLKANNRYQKGYGDGHAAAYEAMAEKLSQIPARG